jgi:catechol 2,3-dioxygenase
MESTTTPKTSLGAGTRVGPVELTVTDLDRSIGFYQDALGLKQHSRQDGTAALGAGGADLVVLAENPQARPAGRHAGLYHFALLHPSRLELSRAARRLAETRTPIQGASDHGVSEAIYLPDPDGNGIEIYADRPREQWEHNPDGSLVMYTAALDLDDLLALAGDDPEVPRHADPGLTMGHVHLHANDLREAVRFYRDVLGFDSMAAMPSAAFLSAGGYHHHLGVNTWRGEGIPGAPGGDVVGLRRWNLVLESQDELDRVAERLEAAGAPVEGDARGVTTRDPAGISVRLSASPA